MQTKKVEYHWYRPWNGRINDSPFDKNVEDVDLANFKILNQNSPGETEEDKVMIVCVTAGIGYKDS
jgi:hypothetical protein